MNLKSLKNIFRKESSSLTKNDISYKAKDIVQVIKNVPNLDILPGDTYSVKEVSEDGKSIKINHNLGTRFDVFLSVDNFKLSYQSISKKVKP